MLTNVIAITELVKGLGYKDYESLANKIRDVLKTKENFARFIVEDESDRARKDARPEKVLVSRDAEMLIDNLAILNIFSGVFPRAKTGDTDAHIAYRSLKTGVDEKDFKKGLMKLKDRFKKNIATSEEGLSQLSSFANAVLSQKTIDIEKDSLRKLMEASEPNVGIHDFGRSYQLGAWNELLGLQQRVSDEGESSEIFQEIGEKFIDLGDEGQAFEALERSIELNGRNGVAHAMRAVLLSRQLNMLSEDWMSVNARTEYSGGIVNPINSEEHWINERLDSISGDHAALRIEFVNAAINALIFWPAHDFNPSDEKSNYLYDLRHSRSTSFEFKRESLFLILIYYLKHEDIESHRAELEQIIRSFQSYQPEMYPLSNILTSSNKVKKDWVKVMAWMSEEDYARAVNELIKICKTHTHPAHNNLELVLDPSVQSAIVAHVGRKEYSELVGRLFSIDAHVREVDHLTKLAELQLNEVMGPLQCIRNALDIKHQIYGEFPPPWIKSEVSNEEQVGEIFLNSMERAEGWKSHIDNPVFLEGYPQKELPHALCRLALLSSLLEISFDRNVAKNVPFISSFCSSSDNLSRAVQGVEESLLRELVSRAGSKSPLVGNSEFSTSLDGILAEKERSMREELMDEDYGP